jgi:hypothetical protein
VNERRPQVKWFTLVLGAALLLLGYKTYFYRNPRLTAELASALARAGLLFFALGGLSIAAAAIGAAWRSPKARLLDVIVALAYVGAGLFLLSMRGGGSGRGLFESPFLPAALLVIGLLKMGITARELRKRTPPPEAKRKSST